MHWSELDGTFLGTPRVWQEIREIRVISPWSPFWQERPPDAEPGAMHRPEYYAEQGWECNGVQAQAIGTAYATHAGGIMQGPFSAPVTSRVQFTMSAMQRTPEQNGGSGSMWALIAPAGPDGKPDMEKAICGALVHEDYGCWVSLGVEWISDGSDFWVGAEDMWLYRAQHCVTIFGSAGLVVTPPFPNPDPPVDPGWDDVEFEIVVPSIVILVRPKRTG